MPVLAPTAFIFFVASFAELNRPPFDMPVADSEIIFGHMTSTPAALRLLPAEPSTPASSSPARCSRCSSRRLARPFLRAGSASGRCKILRSVSRGDGCASTSAAARGPAAEVLLEGA
jgi:hypothetical protein